MAEETRRDRLEERLVARRQRQFRQLVKQPVVVQPPGDQEAIAPLPHGLVGVAGSPIGYGIVIGALVIDCFMAVYTRKQCRDYDTVDLSSVRMLVATLVVAPLSLAWVGFDVSAVTATGITASSGRP